CAPLCELQLRNQTAFPAPIPNSPLQHVAVVSGKVAVAAKYQAIFAVATPRFSSPIPGSELRAIFRKIYIKVQFLLRQLPSSVFTRQIRECLRTSPAFGCEGFDPPPATTNSNSQHSDSICSGITEGISLSKGSMKQP